METDVALWRGLPVPIKSQLSLCSVHVIVGQKARPPLSCLPVQTGQLVDGLDEDLHVSSGKEWAVVMDQSKIREIILDDYVMIFES
jgi:hypothetical protein